MSEPGAEHGSEEPPPPVGEEPVPPPAETVTAHEPPAEDGPATPARKRPNLFVRIGEHLSWTDSQRRGMLVVMTLVLGVLAFRAIRDRAFVPDPQPPLGQKAAELTSRIDPNSASLDELIALPQLGEKRAKAVIEYRERWQKYHPNEPAFAEPLDMVKVTGIGAAMKDNLAPYLIFPVSTSRTAATHPATKDSRPPRKTRPSAK